MAIKRVKQASTELVQNQIILMLLSVGLIALAFLLYGIFSDTSGAPFIESALGINALLAFLFGYLLPQKIGGVNRLYRFGLLRTDIFNTYLRVGMYYILNTVTLILFIGVFFNIIPFLNNFNSSLEVELLYSILSTTLYAFGLYILGVAIRIAINGPRVYALVGIILLIVMIQPLFGGASPVFEIVTPLILIVISISMLFLLLREIEIEEQS